MSHASIAIVPYHRGRPVRTFCMGLALLGLVTGCSVTHSLRPHYDLKDIPDPDPMTAKLGVHYSPEFQQEKHVRLFGSSRNQVEIGKESVTLFDELVSRSVTDVVPVESREPTNDGETNLDGIIEPSIESFSYPLGLESHDARHGIAYRIALYTPEGLPIDSWMIEGREEANPWALPAIWVGEDIRAAGEQFVELFAGATEGAVPPIEQALSDGKDVRRDVTSPGSDLTVDAAGTALATPSEDQAEDSDDKIVLVSLQVSVRYQGSAQLEILPWTARLETPGGRLVSRVSPSRVLSLKADPDYGYDIAGAFFGSIVLVPMAADTAAGAKERLDIEETMRAQLLQQAHLENGTEIEGTLHFAPVEPIPAFDRATLDLWVRSGADRVFRVRVPIEDIEINDGTQNGDADKEA